MKRLILACLLCLLLLASCAPEGIEKITPKVDGDVDCHYLATWARYCEVKLSDGTRCVIAFTSSSGSSPDVECNWK